MKDEGKKEVELSAYVVRFSGLVVLDLDVFLCQCLN